MCLSRTQHHRQAGRVNSVSLPATLCICFLAFPGLYLLTLSGCQNSSDDASSGTSKITRTASSQRAERRAYDGAPPVIPHPRLGATCTECHTETGKAVPDRGYAPANPHLHTAGLSATANCSQCHVFKNATETFAENDFVGLAQTFAGGDRLYPGAPPVIPHRVFMRENCNACHDGPSAREEIRCDHAQRTNCRQCHVDQEVTSFEPVWNEAD